jgi:adenine-specific DNA-methyltransferase
MRNFDSDGPIETTRSVRPGGTAPHGVVDGRPSLATDSLHRESETTRGPRVSTLSNLLRAVAEKDPQLAADLTKEVHALSERRAFGLNFERHTPETVDLSGRAIRRGDKVRFLAPRGASPRSVDQRCWKVMSIERAAAGRIAHVARQDTAESEVEAATRAVEDLVVVAEFRDPIYPGLVSTAKVERGGNKPLHTVINAENFHALQALLYAHEGKVDAIYIDPPYNTGARDWKYNNDYVDGDDIYRHSKWLAFMERRLKLARRLLRPEASVLIVTIDEKEYLRLGLLLQQTFPGARIQMVSNTISPRGTNRDNEFSRVDEYIFFVFIGDATISVGTRSGHDEEVRWLYLRRTATNSTRARGRPNQFYPVYINPNGPAGPTIARIGEPIPAGVDRGSVPDMPGCVTLWPVNPNGVEMTWGMTPGTLQKSIDDSFVRVSEGSAANAPYVVAYLSTVAAKKVADGEYIETGRRPDGSRIVTIPGGRATKPTTAWRNTAHDAGAYGTGTIAALVPGRSFPFPKSLYAVEDTLRYFVEDNPNALVVDFFAGSGTTAHAVMRLNKQDGGRRRSISVTNNEVSADEQKDLRKKGLRPGDLEWEAFGICEHITKPRLLAAVTGRTPDGKPVQGGYKFTDEFPMANGFEENVEFFTMTYEAPRSVAHHKSFEAVAPLLWLKAGAEGRRIEQAAESFDVADVYGVLFDMDASHDFLEAVGASDAVRMAFIVTDDDRAYQMVCADLPAHVEPVRLYESYLTNFTINTGRD